MSITWTDEARRYLTPRSVDDLPRRKPVLPELALVAWRADAKLFLHKPWTAAADLAEPARLAHAVLTGAAGLESLTPVAWSVALRVVPSGLPLAAGHLGLAPAIDAALAACELSMEVRGALEIRRGTPPRPPRFPDLEELILRASADERAAVNALTDARWAAATAPQRMLLLTARPDRPDWAAALVPGWIASVPRDGEGWRTLVARLDRLDLAETLLEHGTSANVVDLVARFGDAALPVLAKALAATKESHAYKHLARAVALYDDPVAAAALAPLVSKTSTQPVVLEYFSRLPHHKGALEALAKGKNALAKKAGEVLARLPQGTASASAEAVVEGALPTLLVTPPWARPKAKKGAKPEPAIPFELPAFAPYLVAAPHDAHRTRALTAGARPMTDAEADAFEAWVVSKQPSGMVGQWTDLPRARALALYASWPDERPHLVSMATDAIALFGLDALPGLCREAAATRYPSWASRVAAPEMAMVLLRRHDDEEVAPLVGDWLSAHPAAALAGLVPVALGPDTEQRLAERGLAELVRLHGPSVLAPLGPAAAPLRARLSDVARFGPEKAPKLPASLATLPDVRTRAGTVLPRAAIEALLGYVMASDLALRHPAIEVLRGELDARDLAELAWSLASTWEMTGAKKKDTWMIDALAALAHDDEDVVRRTLPQLKKPRAATVLASIATDAAAVELLSGTARSGSHTTFHALERLTGRRGQTLDELEEGLAPSFAGGGPFEARIGDAGYRIGVDAQLKVTVERSDGKRLERLPPRQGDERPEEARARARFAELSADVALLVPRRIRLLERRMIAARTTSMAQVRAQHLEHPLWSAIGRALVWAWQDGEAIRASFRVAEDGTLADDEDRPIDIPGDAPVTLAHPLRLAPAVLARWSAILADYHVVQPFPQIDRGLVRPSAAELAQPSLRRAAKLPPSQHLECALALGAATSRAGRWSRHLALRSGVDLWLEGPGEAMPHDVELGASSEVARRTPVPLSEVGEVIVAELFRVAGA